MASVHSQSDQPRIRHLRMNCGAQELLSAKEPVSGGASAKRRGGWMEVGGIMAGGMRKETG